MQSSLPAPETLHRYRQWWETLSTPWQQAFNEAYQNKSETGCPPDEVLDNIWTNPNFRMAGPSAMFPNVTLELEDLSGVAGLTHLELLVFTNHNITHLRDIAHLRQIRSLFVFSNKIDTLEGVEQLGGLTGFYFNDNQVRSLLPLAGLTQLETIHCANNQLQSFEGIGKQHSRLKDFFCLPNPGIWQSAILQFENDVRVQCKKG